MAKKVDYPAAKKALWEVWRTFGLAFLGVVSAQLQAGAGTEDLNMWVRSVVIAAVVAGIRAIIKWAREKWGLQNYDSLLYKIPA